MFQLILPSDPRRRIASLPSSPIHPWMPLQAPTLSAPWGRSFRYDLQVQMVHTCCSFGLLRTYIVVARSFSPGPSALATHAKQNTNVNNRNPGPGLPSLTGTSPSSCPLRSIARISSSHPRTTSVWNEGPRQSHSTGS